MQLCRIHLASARKASVQPYIFFFAFWEEKPESRMTIQADTGSSANTWVPPYACHRSHLPNKSMLSNSFPRMLLGSRSTAL